jgi:putative aminopeptidase FrvX
MTWSRRRVGILAFLVLLTSARHAGAHHSIGAYYDTTREVTLKGAVSVIEWTNPHVFLHIDVRDERGNVTSWAVESDSPNVLTRAGWTRKTLQPDDEVIAIGFPSKKSLTALRLVTLTLADGRRLKG